VQRRVKSQLSASEGGSVKLGRSIEALWPYLTFLSLRSSFGLMKKARASGVLFDLTPRERREVEAALPAIAPVNETVAVVLRRLLEAGGQAAPSDRPTDEAAAYVSVGEAARFFGVTSQTIRNWADKGLLAADVTPAGTRLIPAVALRRARAFLDAPRPGPRFSEAEIAQIVEHMRD
jgi:hypothetical protein